MQRAYLNNQPWEEALANWISILVAAGALLPGDPEVLPVGQAIGRVTAQRVLARISVPHYPSAAMDGVAIKAIDTYGATEEAAVRLRLGREAVEVDTGDPLPGGMDAVAMIEHVYLTEDGMVELQAAIAPGENVRCVGEDIMAGEMLLTSGHQLRPVDLGGLLAGGVNQLAVHPRPRVAIIPTGDELVDPALPRQPGQIAETNSRVLGETLRQWGAEPVYCPPVPDCRELLQQALEQALDHCQVVIINAGSSAGRDDYTAEVMARLGQVITHGLAIRPGKPVMLGLARDRAVLGLPGYPVSAYLTMDLLLKPLIGRLLGLQLFPVPQVEARLLRKVVSPLGQEEMLRVRLASIGDQGLVAVPLARGSGATTSLIRADGLIRIPRLSEGYLAGSRVSVELWRSLEQIKRTVILAGSHDLALDLLVDRLAREYPGWRLATVGGGSMAGILALKRGETHLGAIHLFDPDSGEYNLPAVQRYLPGEDVVIINFVHRQQGLLVPPGNPKRIEGINDLARGDIKMINRQPGAGTRELLDYLLERQGIQRSAVHGYRNEVYTHLEVAAAVASGVVDTGLGVMAAAEAMKVGFVPLTWERYDLVIPRASLAVEGVQYILRILQQEDFHQQVEQLGGYRLDDCGQVVWPKGAGIPCYIQTVVD